MVIKILNQQQATAEQNTFTNNLKYLLQKNNLTVNKLSKVLEIPFMTLSRIVNGDTECRTSLLCLLAQHFNVTTDDLLTQHLTDNTNQKTTNAALISVPIFLLEELNNIGNLDDLSPDNWHKWQAVYSGKHTSISNKSIAIQTGTALGKRFKHGCLLIIDNTVHPRDGDTVLVKFDNGFSLREFLIDNPQPILQPIASETGAVSFESDKMTIIGTMIMQIVK